MPYGGGYAPPGAPGAAAFGGPPPFYGAPGAPGAPAYYGGPPPGQGGYGGPPPGQGGYGGPPPQDFAPAPQAPPPPPAAPAILLPANALRGFLVSYQSNTQGDFWPLHGGRKTVGRASSGEQVDIPIGDATISSRHAALVIDGAAGTVHVEDTGSTNGTFVNEEHIGFNGKRELRDGDKLRFGGFTTVMKVITRI
jgi:pSer/pThr/pTyr-binding forkhead associated (FHA) protein